MLGERHGGGTRLDRAWNERRLRGRRQRAVGAEAERGAGSVELEGAERLLMEIAILTTSV